MAYKIGDIVNTRNIIGEALYELGARDERVWALTSDCGAPIVDFAKAYPDRYVDTGIAEQNAAGIAAGIAISGGIPYIVGMSTFVTMRAFEQDRTDMGYQDQKVRILGYATGMTTSGGSTHYAMEDVALMSSIVNMAVLSASDPLLVKQAIIAGVDYPHPYYMRITSGKSDEIIYEPGSVQFQFGKGILAREGKDVTIFAQGAMVKYAIRVSDALKQEGISVRVVDMFSIKPLDQELVLRCVKETGKILVWEDHFVNGGLATAIADLCMDQGAACEKFVRVGIPNVYPGFGSDEDLYRSMHMDVESVKQQIRKMV